MKFDVSSYPPFLEGLPAAPGSGLFAERQRCQEKPRERSQDNYEPIVCLP
ncbi:MAG: hypothetical protein U1F76_06530 [Candidatus Competibacteraceae bacterium]